MQTRATFFDGRSAASQDATLILYGDIVEARVGALSFSFGKDSVMLVPPVGAGSWTIQLENGGSLQFDDGEFGDELAKQFGSSRFVDMLERSWRWALVTLVVAVAGTWAMLTYGVPVAAERIAFSVPAELDQKLGEDSIALLDRTLFESSELPAADQARIRLLFKKVRDDYPEAAYFRLEFRSSGIGANAFAVPGGLVVLTDELVALARDDDELIAVLAHEIGHLYERHGLRVLLQDSLSALIIAGLTGDLTNITAFSASIPTLLMQAKYSRDFEREADAFAFDYMERHGHNPDALADLLLRMEQEAGATDSPIDDWLSSHPGSDDRRPEEE